MGAKLSTYHDNRAPIVTSTAAPTSLPSAYNIPPTRWSSNNLPENRPPAAPAAACATFPATRTSSNGTIGGGIGGGGVAFPLKTTNNKEVIVFHSSKKWKEYFETSKQINKLVVIYFTATWCGPCRYMEPTIKELAAKYAEVDIVKIDVDELFNVSREFGVQVMPTFLFMKKGVQIDQVVGAKKEDLQKKVEKHRA